MCLYNDMMTTGNNFFHVHGVSMSRTLTNDFDMIGSGIMNISLSAPNLTKNALRTVQRVRREFVPQTMP